MNILVTGGASFIGSHLVERLVEENKGTITVVDNFSTGSIHNLHNVRDKITVKELDLFQFNNALEITKNIDLVYHLAAVHGGREYIHYHEPETADNFVINHNLLKACLKNDVNKLIFTSSACVYPENLQNKNYVHIKEDDITLSGLLQADKLYGWSKLIFEMELKVFHETYGLKSAIARFFTAYGPRENATHAIIALLDRALKREDPYLIWGDGTQGRDFIYVDDLVDGLIKLDKINDASPINLGYGTLITINEVVNTLFDFLGFYPKIKYDLSKPVGPYRRVADITKARKTLNWAPKISLKEGLKSTYRWSVKETM